MNMKSKVASPILGLMLGVASISAHAAAAVAVGDDGYVYTALNKDDLETAERLALEGCGKKSTNCRTSITTTGPETIAIAKGDGGTYVVSRKDPQAALSRAIEQCKKHFRNCKPTVIYWEEGMRWAAFAAAVENNEAPSGFYSYGATSKSAAHQGALEGCKKQLPEEKQGFCKIVTSVNESQGVAIASSKSASWSTWHASVEKAKDLAVEGCRKASKPGDVCTIVKVFENPGPQPKPKNFDSVFATTVVAQEERKAAQQLKQQTVRTSAVQRVTCENKCVNGDCIRIFPDGRKERWQAPRVYDPFSRDWKWDTSSCGG